MTPLQVFFIYTQLWILKARSDSVDIPHPCSIQAVDCIADATYGDNSLYTSLEVSCQCKKTKDVSDRLASLKTIRCPLIPRSPKSPKFNHTKLRIEKCNVEKKPFPVEILRVLRRSHKFEVSVTDVDTLRLESDKEMEDTKAVIQAEFKKSKINGLGLGWFSNAEEITLKVEHCSVDVVEQKFIYGSYKKASIKFENTIIKTINSFAFHLPSNGIFEFEGGKILQLESDAIYGGREVQFNGVMIDNIQKYAVNIYGLEKFTIDACILIKIHKEAIQEDMRHGTSSHIIKEFNVNKVEIKSNKVIDADGEAFSSLCRIKELVFKDNLFLNVSSSLSLKSEFCSINRDWWKSLSNNGFACHNCRNLFGPRVNEQVCVLYVTGWCLCNDRPLPNLIDDPKSELENKTPCRDLVKDAVVEKCPEFKEFDAICASYYALRDEFSSRARWRSNSPSWTSKLGPPPPLFLFILYLLLPTNIVAH